MRNIVQQQAIVESCLACRAGLVRDSQTCVIASRNDNFESHRAPQHPRRGPAEAGEDSAMKGRRETDGERMREAVGDCDEVCDVRGVVVVSRGEVVVARGVAVVGGEEVVGARGGAAVGGEEVVGARGAVAVGGEQVVGVGGAVVVGGVEVVGCRGVAVVCGDEVVGSRGVGVVGGNEVVGVASGSVVGGSEAVDTSCPTANVELPRRSRRRACSSVKQLS
jgi:hypothetical protein